MKKKTAIKILNNQIEKLGNSENQTKSWIIETQTYLESFFGENSRQSQYLNHKNFNPTPGFSVQLEIEKTIKHLNDCKSTIDNIGLYKPPKKNFLSQLPDWLLALILTTITSLAFLIGKYTSDIQNFELRQENIQLKKIKSETTNLKKTDSLTV